MILVKIPRTLAYDFSDEMKDINVQIQKAKSQGG